METPLVSVIVPVYNGERFLAATLGSVLAQDYRPIEILVIDDGSADGSAEIARGFSEVRYFHQSNQGAAVARNLGIENALGELVAFIDADDTWMPGKLTLQVRHLLDHPELGFVLTRQRIFLEPGVEKPAWLKPELLENDSVGYIPSTLLARKTVFAQIGGFDPKYVPAEDVEWFFRAKDFGIAKGVVPEVLLHKRVHDSNLAHGTAISQPRLLQALKSSIERQRKPLVSVIMPAYNRELYLAAAIESMLAQAYRPLEIVVIDDGSTDGTADVARRYAPTVRYEYHEHGGIASARNHALALAKGEYLAFLDSDDLWEEDQLAVQMEVLRSNPDLDCLYGQVTEFISPELDPELARKIVCRSEPMPSRGPGAIIKAEAFRRVGPFRSQGQVGEFLDWQLRASELGLKTMMLPQVVNRRRLHTSNQSSVQRSSPLDYVRILKASLDRRRNQGELDDQR